MAGSLMTSEEVLCVVRRDRPFYDESGGGMTLSGGEPLMQPQFCRSLLAMARSEDMQTVVETSAYCAWETIEAVVPLVDLFLVDIKQADDARHRQLTGVSNERIVENIKRLDAAGAPMRLRVPLIPALNMDEAFLASLVALLQSLVAPPPVELMLYHPMGLGKAAGLGMVASIPPDIPAATREDAAPWIARLSEEGFTATIG
jgi:pyruvate formate lyase activating enzyme